MGKKIISEVRVSIDDQERFPVTLNRFESGVYDTGKILAFLKDRTDETVRKFYNEVNGRACLLSVGMTGVDADSEKAAKLFKLAELIEMTFPSAMADNPILKKMTQEEDQETKYP